MSHEIESMAFANALPWHGLGNRVDASISPEEMLVAAGLDWTVQMHPNFTSIDGNMHRVPNQSSLVRSSDNKILTTASDRWQPVQNREMLEFFRDYARAGGATLETAGSLRGGKLVWGLANLGKGFVTNNGRDAVKGYLLFASPHEAGKATTVRATSIRVVCANTMALAVGKDAALYSQNHLTGFNAEAAKMVVGAAIQSVGEAEAKARTLEALHISEFDTVRVLAKHFQPEHDGTDAAVAKLISDVQKRSQALHQVLLSNEQAPGAAPGNGWGVLNAVTYWADHVAGRDRSARLTQSWFGTTEKVKVAIERDLLEMAA